MGSAKLGRLRAHRWVYVTFGDDLFGSIMLFTSDGFSEELGRSPTGASSTPSSTPTSTW